MVTRISVPSRSYARRFRAKILVLDNSGMHETEYEATEHFQITKDFLNARQSFLRHLLDDDEE